MRKYIILLLALSLAASGMQAQNRRRAARKAKTTLTPEEKMLQEKIASMTAATQKIVFVDSTVTGKGEFLLAINLPEEAGGIDTYNSFFATEGQDSSLVYVNQMHNKCYYALAGEDGGMSLYTSDMIDQEWSDPLPLAGLEEISGDDQSNYPFMMADGATLYFAAKGSESIGGYDIFVTRYNAESGKFFKPENIGMPFNSTANDYLYAIDEYDNIGWLVTDRNQPEGKVCVYTFVPSEAREAYDPDTYTDDQIKNFAGIHSIADTWGDGTEKDKAMARIADIAKRQQQSAVRAKKKSDMAFMVNDQTTYTSISQFHSDENADNYRKLAQHIRNKKELDTKLQSARDYYATANKAEQAAIAQEIIQSERQSELLETTINKLTKELRNSENRFINKQ